MIAALGAGQNVAAGVECHRSVRAGECQTAVENVVPKAGITAGEGNIGVSGQNTAGRLALGIHGIILAWLQRLHHAIQATIRDTHVVSNPAAWQSGRLSLSSHRILEERSVGKAADRSLRPGGAAAKMNAAAAANISEWRSY